jgi:hypothetical protein
MRRYSDCGLNAAAAVNGDEERMNCLFIVGLVEQCIGDVSDELDGS